MSCSYKVKSTKWRVRENSLECIISRSHEPASLELFSLTLVWKGGFKVNLTTSGPGKMGSEFSPEFASCEHDHEESDPDPCRLGVCRLTRGRPHSESHCFSS